MALRQHPSTMLRELIHVELDLRVQVIALGHVHDARADRPWTPSREVEMAQVLSKLSSIPESNGPALVN